MALSPKEIEMMKYYQENGQLHPDTQLKAEAAGLFPGGLFSKVGTAAKGGLSGGLSKYFNDLFGRNLPKHLKEAKNVAKNQKKINKALLEPTSRYSKRALVNKKKELNNHALNVAQVAEKARIAQQNARIGTGVAGGILASEMMSDGSDPIVQAVPVAQNVQVPSEDIVANEPYDYSGGNRVDTPIVNKPSYYGDKIDLGDPEGRFIPGYAGARLNEVGSKRRPIPSPGNIINTVRNAQSKTKKPYIAEDVTKKKFEEAAANEVKQELKSTPFGKGMSHAQRLEYFNDPEAYLNKVDGRISYE